MSQLRCDRLGRRAASDGVAPLQGPEVDGAESRGGWVEFGEGGWPKFSPTVHVGGGNGRPGDMGGGKLITIGDGLSGS